MLCSRYKIVYFSPANGNEEITLLDYCDTIDIEINTNRLYTNQEVPWVRGNYTGFIPRKNLSHSFGFKKLSDSLDHSTLDIPYARFTAFSTSPTIRNPDRGDFIEITFGEYNPSLSSSCKVADSQYKVILKNAVIENVFYEYDMIHSDRLWSTYNIKYGECLEGVSNEDFILTGQYQSESPSTDEYTITNIGTLVGDPWLLQFSTITTGLSTNGKTISIAPNTSEYFNLSGFTSSLSGENITVQCPFGRYVYIEAEEENIIISYDNGSGGTIIPPQPQLGIAFSGYSNSKPRFTIDDWVVQWSGSQWVVANDVVLFTSSETVAYPWEVGFWTATPSVSTGTLAAVTAYCKTSEFVTYLETYVLPNSAMNLDMTVADIGTYDTLQLQTTLITTLTGGTDFAGTVITLQDQSGYTLYQNF